MAEVTTSFSGGSISYRVNSGTTEISVLSGGQYLTRANSTSAAISDLNRNISESQNLIKALKAKIAEYNKELSKPDLSDFFREDYTKNIKELQGEISYNEKYIANNQAAISSINSSGQSSIAKATEEDNKALSQLGLAPTPLTPTPPATLAATNAALAAGSDKPVSGSASDDSGAKQPNPAGSTGKPTASPAAPAGTGGSTAAKSGTTAAPGTAPAGATGTNTSKPADASTGAYKFQASFLSKQSVATASQPGKRLRNPLGEFSSYTYQITLYMISPDAYEAFIQSGRKKINVLSESNPGTNGGAFIIAQSGGINKSSEKRAPGFVYDYGIDNLKITQALPGKGTSTTATISDITFTITEPYGFSFLSNLRRASDALLSYAKDFGKGPENPGRQFFILGIRFLGYDASGRVMKPNTKMASNGIDPTGKTETQWGVVDPRSQSGELFEYFIDIVINEMTFKIDGKTVNYNITAAQSSISNAYSVSRGVLQKTKTVDANTVGVALDKLLVLINEEQANLAKGDKPALRYPNKYEIIWLPGTEDILNASIVSKARLEKFRWPGSGAKTTTDSNASKETTSQSANNILKSFTFNGGEPIVKLINEIIKNSSYLEDALKVLYTSAVEADPKTKSEAVKKPSYQKQTVSWFSVTPQISEIKWDDIVKNWSYKISYMIGKFYTPVVDTPVVAGGKNYYGPHKRYDYWYTGENREILSYQQTMDQTYMNVVLDGNATPEKPAAGSGETTKESGDTPAASGSQTPTQPNMQTNESKVGSTGFGLEMQNAYLTALLDPGAYSQAEISILGDPDYLIAEPVYSPNQVYDQFYGSSTFSINPAGGQIFVEIDFKEGIDYTSNTGTLNINESILFYKYPASISKLVKGVSYTVTEIESNFNNGMFKQKLNLVINEFGQDTAPASGKTDEAAGKQRETGNAAPSTATTGSTPKNSTTTSTQTTGTPKDPPATTKVDPSVQRLLDSPPLVDANGRVTSTAQPVVQTPAGPVANDDGVSTNTTKKTTSTSTSSTTRESTSSPNVVVTTTNTESFTVSSSPLPVRTTFV